MMGIMYHIVLSFCILTWSLVSVVSTGSLARSLGERQINSPYSITGVQTSSTNGSLQARQEIRVLQGDPDLWNLYLLGLNRLQSASQTDKLSWYQIAGIHGRPFIPWDDVETNNNPNSGYCTHGSVLFPVWHRPYLALFEQVLYNVIQSIAREFQGADQQRYIAAASAFRIPYWDWAAAPPEGQSVLPDSIGGSPTVVVTTPQGVETINNPLYTYGFHPLKVTDIPDFPFSEWNTTLRYPTDHSPAAVSHDSLVATQLDLSRVSVRDRVFNLLSNYPDYSRFSNKNWIPSDVQTGVYESVESIHDTIHGLVGVGGHMSVVDYSAFDPIFFLHHTSIDRIIALWQALYPDSFVEPTPATGTFTNPPGSIENIDTALTPFHRSSSPADFWTARTARDYRTFGYTYPELVSQQTSSEQEFQGNVRAIINTLYGRPPASSPVIRRDGEQKGSMHSSVVRRTQLYESEEAKQISETGYYDSSITSYSSESPPAGQGVGAPQQPPTENNPVPLPVQVNATAKLEATHTEYVANIRVAKNAIPGSFFVYIFLGDFDPHPKDWATDPNLVGIHCVFGNEALSGSLNSTTTNTTNSTSHLPSAQSLVAGTVPLTTTLLAHVTSDLLPSLSPAQVTPYLKENLHWRIATSFREAVSLPGVAGLEISVVSSTVTVPLADNGERDLRQLPSWGPFTAHVDITRGRSGGMNSTIAAAADDVGAGAGVGSAAAEAGPQPSTVANVRYSTTTVTTVCGCTDGPSVAVEAAGGKDKDKDEDNDEVEGKDKDTAEPPASYAQGYSLAAQPSSMARKYGGEWIG